MFKYELLELTDDAIIFPVPPEFLTLDFDYDWYSEMMKLPYYKDNFYKLTRDFFEKFEVKVFLKSDIEYNFSIDNSYLKLSIEHFLKCYEHLDDAIKVNFSSFKKNHNFTKKVLLSLDDSEAMHYFLTGFNELDNRIGLDCLYIGLKRFIEMRNTNILTQLFEYRNKHYSKHEISDYYDKEEKLLIGFDL